ncbi:MAG: ATP-binding protein [bacterium]
MAQLEEQKKELDRITQLLEKRNIELAEMKEKHTKELQELDHIAKTLVRRDMILSETRLKREEELKELEKRTKELEHARKVLIDMLKEAKEAQRKIEEEKNKTKATLNSLTDGLIIFDKNERILFVNPKAEKVLNIKEKEVFNKKIRDISDCPSLSKFYETLGRKIEWTGRRYDLVLGAQTKRFFQVSVTPATIEKEAFGMIVILHDITREKEIDRMKTEFVSIAAHQLRTPLSAIKWTLRMLLDGDAGKVSVDQIDLLNKGYQSNERMIVLINDLLNISRIEEGRFIQDLSLQSLDKIIDNTISSLSGLIKKNKINLIFKKPNKQLPKIKVDKEKIELVIQNLLSNAVSYTQKGGNVTVEMKYDNMNIEVMVKDTGIGIPIEQQNRIFTKFFRADNAVLSETEGTGLGLFMCKNIIEAHGGKIWFESKQGQGSVFDFILPVNNQ